MNRDAWLTAAWFEILRETAASPLHRCRNEDLHLRHPRGACARGHTPSRRTTLAWGSPRGRNRPSDLVVRRHLPLTCSTCSSTADWSLEVLNHVGFTNRNGVLRGIRSLHHPLDRFEAQDKGDNID